MLAGKGGSGPNRGAAAGSGQATKAAQPASQDPDVWLLGALLLSGLGGGAQGSGEAAGASSTAASSAAAGAVPASILGSAAAACKLAAHQLQAHAHGHGGEDATAAHAAERLLGSMGAMLGVLNTGRPVQHLGPGAHAGSGVASTGNTSFRPTLEQWGALLSALSELQPFLSDLKGGQASPSPGSQAEVRLAWGGLISTTLKGMLLAVQGHPAPKKVFQAVAAPALALPLLHLAFPQSVSMAALLATLGLAQGPALGPGAGAGAAPSAQAATAAAALSEEVQVLARSVLEAALLHDAHVGGLADACARMAAPDLDAASATVSSSARGTGLGRGHSSDTVEGGAGEGKGTEGQKDKAASRGSYHAQLFQVGGGKPMRFALRGACGQCCFSRHEGAGPSMPKCVSIALRMMPRQVLGDALRAGGRDAGAALCCLPWLLRRFAVAVVRQRRLATTGKGRHAIMLCAMLAEECSL